jgi:hypothetical protein
VDILISLRKIRAVTPTSSQDLHPGSHLQSLVLPIVACHVLCLLRNCFASTKYFPEPDPAGKPADIRDFAKPEKHAAPRVSYGACRTVSRRYTMAVTFQIPDYLASFTDRQTSITLDASPQTIGQALEFLWNQYPGLHDRIVDEQSQVRPQLNVFIANDPICRKEGLATRLPSGASVSILPALGML